MNEKLVSWFEDLLPEIRDTGDVEGTLLKFANDKNLAPALLEKIGHVYNTAKTVNYLDKAASHDMHRGESFGILDVPALLEKYAETTPDNAEYSNNDFSSLAGGKFPDLFKNDHTGVATEDLFQPMDEYHEIKMASEKHTSFAEESVKAANAETTDQLIFDLTEDNSNYAKKLSDRLRDPDCEYSFEQLEKDATNYMEGAVTEACDFFHGYLSQLGMHEKRASDSGKPRLIKDTSYLLSLAQIQDNLNTIKMASDVKKNFFLAKEAAGSSTKTKPTKSRPRHSESPSGTGGGGESALGGGPPLISDAQMESAYRTGVGGTTTAVRGVADAAGNLTGLGGNESLGRKARMVTEDLDEILDAVGAPYRREKQEQVDDEMAELEYETLIQDLMITDPILSEEDSDRVLDIYNTIKGVAPELAKKKDVMRVALRSAIQHEGISPFDLQQFAETEKELQKVRHNVTLEKDKNYMTDKSKADYPGNPRLSS